MSRGISSNQRTRFYGSIECGKSTSFVSSARTLLLFLSSTWMETGFIRFISSSDSEIITPTRSSSSYMMCVCVYRSFSNCLIRLRASRSSNRKSSRCCRSSLTYSSEALASNFSCLPQPSLPPIPTTTSRVHLRGFSISLIDRRKDMLQHGCSCLLD